MYVSSIYPSISPCIASAIFPPNFMSYYFCNPLSLISVAYTHMDGRSPSGAWGTHQWPPLKKADSFLQELLNISNFSAMCEDLKSPLLMLACRVACSCKGPVWAATAVANSRE